jgi:hypothetical protein
MVLSFSDLKEGFHVMALWKFGNNAAGEAVLHRKCSGTK